ncbi:MAG: ABC transporter permease, partial [Halobacteriales archaeon]|nr:ABC transporter permease [Halobacteriales archaeon]
FAVVIFSGLLGWFPTAGMLSVETWVKTAEMAWWEKYVTLDFLRHWTLPFLVITLRYTLVPNLVMRTSIVEILGQDFIFYHKITGISKLRRWGHLAKHASLPVITLYPVSMTRSIGGLVLVEVVFNWPGIGSALVNAVFARDIPVIQFVFFTIASMVIVANFGIDILYGLIDPRVSVEAEGN